MQELQFCQRESLKVDHILMKDMGLVKTRRLAAMQKQQRAKARMKPPVKTCGDMLLANRRDDGYGL